MYKPAGVRAAKGKVMDKDIYELLGVKKNATDSEIRKAFLKLAEEQQMIESLLKI